MFHQHVCHPTVGNFVVSPYVPKKNWKKINPFHHDGADALEVSQRLRVYSYNHAFFMVELTTQVP